MVDNKGRRYVQKQAAVSAADWSSKTWLRRVPWLTNKKVTNLGKSCFKPVVGWERNWTTSREKQPVQTTMSRKQG